MRFAILYLYFIAIIIACKVRSVFGWWFLFTDLVYIILFPQLVCVLYFKKFSNTYGSLCAYIIGFLLRILGGEEIIGLPVLLKYPYFLEETGQQLFPFRTLSMLISLSTLLAVSCSSKWLFENRYIPPALDIFHCVVNIPEDILKVLEPHKGEMSVLNAQIAMAKTYKSEMNGRINPGCSV
ncbi:high-affinity choline transporter 1-like [Parasteatoda tepidariorum]|uniref:high-affinity choline transporter 1-like n=1 Tax=Parasteatoda tepidariorum TaxID=114398 RepID=UPI0039BC6F99